jgi:predicted lipoprotein
MDWQNIANPFTIFIPQAMKHLKALTAISSFLFLLACGGKEKEPSPADNSKDRKIILTHWVDNIILRSYEEFREVFDVMVEKEATFRASPDQTSLTDFREAWVAAYLAWQKVELFEFGAAGKYSLRNFFNIYPADVNGIVANMNEPSPNFELTASYARQGFPALDYLLNGVGTDDTAILAAYTTDPDAAKRLVYIGRITSRMNTLLTNVITEWKGAYRDSFIDRTGLDIGSSMGQAVNAYVLYYERYIRSGKIGIPSGAAIGSSGVPYPERVEAYYKGDISGPLAKNAHQAAHDFFNGVDIRTNSPGPSLKSYLDALGAKDAATGTMLSEIINNQFVAIHSELDQLSSDFQEQIQNNNAEMVDTYTAMQRLVRILKVDMTSAMSVTITYTDTDGD